MSRQPGTGKIRSMSFGSKTPSSRNSSPTMPGGPSTKRTTRSTNVVLLTSAEIEAQPSTVNDAASAHLYLKKKSLCHATEPYTLNHLISVLLQITQISGSIPLPVLTAIRSVIFLLKRHEADEIAETVALQVSTTVAQQISDSITTKLVDHVIAAIAPQVAKILIASESLEHAAQSIELIKPLSSNPDPSPATTTQLTQLTPQILEQITSSLAPQLDQLTSTSKSLTNSLENSEQLRKLVESRVDLDRDIDASADRITHATDTLFCAIEDCQSSMDLISPSLETTQQRLNTLSLQFLTQPPTPSQPMPKAPQHNLYSNIATPKTHTQIPAYSAHPATTTRGYPPNPSRPIATSAPQPASADAAIARSAIRARQILLDPIPGNLFLPENISHEATSSKINTAITSALAPNNHQGHIKALIQLRNGGLIVELDSELTLTRLQEHNTRKRFLQALDNSVIFKDRTYTLVLQYVPVNVLINRTGLLRLMEGKNQLADNSLASMRWIKPPHKRPPGQTMAFALLQVNDPETANKLIKEGLYIDRNLIRVKKDKREPIRCAKCQRFSHIARNCNANKDTCGTCADTHRTDDCNAYKTVRCVSCRSNDHASWSRDCPEFGKRSDDLSLKYPENSLPYFPTSETWTHTLLPPKAAPYERPTPTPTMTLQTEPNSTLPPPHFRQTTLTSSIAPAKPRPHPTVPTARLRTPTIAKAVAIPSQLVDNTNTNTNRFSPLSIDDANPAEDNSNNLNTDNEDSTPTPTYTPLWFPPSSTPSSPTSSTSTPPPAHV